MAYGDASLSQQIFNVSMAQAESVVEPDRIADDIRRKPVALVCFHRKIVAKYNVNLAVPRRCLRTGLLKCEAH